MNQQNGNPQLNGAREDVNKRTSKKAFIGKAFRQTLNSKRRFRSI